MPDIFDYSKTGLAPAFAGMLAETQYKDVLSLRWPETQDDPLPVGHVARYSGDANIADDAAATTPFAGVAVFSHALDETVPFTGVGDIAAYKPGEVAGLLRKGTIWVPVAGATNIGPAYFTAAGVVTGTSGGNTAIPGGVIETETTGPGLVRLRLG